MKIWLTKRQRDYAEDRGANELMADCEWALRDHRLQLKTVRLLCRFFCWFLHCASWRE